MLGIIQLRAAALPFIMLFCGALLLLPSVHRAEVGRSRMQNVERRGGVTVTARQVQCVMSTVIGMDSEIVEQSFRNCHGLCIQECSTMKARLRSLARDDKQSRCSPCGGDVGTNAVDEVDVSCALLPRLLVALRLKGGYASGRPDAERTAQRRALLQTLRESARAEQQCAPEQNAIDELLRQRAATALPETLPFNITGEDEDCAQNLGDGVGGEWEPGSSFEEEQNIFVKVQPDVDPVYDEEYDKMREEAVAKGETPPPKKIYHTAYWTEAGLVKEDVSNLTELSCRRANAAKNLTLGAPWELDYMSEFRRRYKAQEALFPLFFNLSFSNETRRLRERAGIGENATLVKPFTAEAGSYLRTLDEHHVLPTAANVSFNTSASESATDAMGDAAKLLQATSVVAPTSTPEWNACDMTACEVTAGAVQDEDRYNEVLEEDGEKIPLGPHPVPSFKVNVSRPPDHEWFQVRDDGLSGLIEEYGSKLPDITSLAYPDGVPEVGTCATACIAEAWHEEDLHTRTHGRHGNMQRAIAYYHRALQLAPDNADAHERLGSVMWREHGDADLAGRLLGRAVSLDPHSLTPLHALREVAREVVEEAGDQTVESGLRGERGGTRTARKRSVTVHEKERFRDVLTWVEGRLGEVEALVEEAENVDHERHQRADVPGEDVYTTIMRRALEQTLIDIPRVVPAGPQNLEELLRTGGSRERDEEELVALLQGSDGTYSVDSLETTKQGRAQVDSIFRWASPELKEALLAKRRAKHEKAREQRSAKVRAMAGGEENDVYSLEMDRDHQRDQQKLEEFLGVGDFDNMWEGAEGEGEGEWDEAKERERLSNPLQDAIRELLEEAKHSESARAEVQDINSMMRGFVEKYNATSAVKAVVKNFAVRAGFEDLFPNSTESAASPPAASNRMENLGENVDMSQWAEAVPMLTDLEAARVAMGNLSLRGIDCAIEVVGKEGESCLQGHSVLEAYENRQEESDTEEMFGKEIHTEPLSLVDALEEGEDPAILFRDSEAVNQDVVTLRDRVIELGQLVRVQGLENAPGFNGMVGRVAGVNRNGRVQVLFNHSCSRPSNDSMANSSVLPTLEDGLSLKPEKLVLVQEGEVLEGQDALMQMKFPWLEKPGTGPGSFGGPGYWQFLLGARTVIELKEWGERLAVLGEGNLTDISIHLAERAHERFVGALKSGNWADEGLQDVMKMVSFRWGGAHRWGVTRRRKRRRARQAGLEGQVWADFESKNGEDSAELLAEGEEEEEMAYESLLCGPEGEGAELEDDLAKRKIQTARRRRAEEDEFEDEENEEEWGGARWVGREVPVCGCVDPEIPGLTEFQLEKMLRADSAANALCGWQTDVVIEGLKSLFVQTQREASAAFDPEWDQGVLNVDVGRYSVEENPELLTDAQMTSIERCLEHTEEEILVDANTTDPAKWGELGPQLGGFVLASVNKTYDRGGLWSGPQRAAAPGEPTGARPYKSKREMAEIREQILYGMQDARIHEILINHFAALAATATAAGCRSIPEWVDLRGGEEFLCNEIELACSGSGRRPALEAVEREILLAALPEIAEAQRQYARNEPCAGSVPQPLGLASTAELLRGEDTFRARKGWIGVSHWWPRTICTRPEWGFNANNVDGLAGTYRAMYAWGRRWDKEMGAPQGTRQSTELEQDTGDDRQEGHDGDTGGGGGAGIGMEGRINGAAGPSRRWDAGRGDEAGMEGSARRGRRGAGISRSRESESMLSSVVEGRRGRGDTDNAASTAEDSGGDDGSSEDESGESFASPQGRVWVYRGKGTLQLRGGAGDVMQQGVALGGASDPPAQDTHQEQGVTQGQGDAMAASEVQDPQAAARARAVKTVGEASAHEAGLPGNGEDIVKHDDAFGQDKGNISRVLVEKRVEPPHYGTEDESSHEAVEGLPERFQPFAKQVRSLLVRPPRDWKYQVELEKESSEQGEIQRACQQLQDFDTASALLPKSGSVAHARGQLQADKAVAIAASLRRRKFFLPAWQVSN